MNDGRVILYIEGKVRLDSVKIQKKLYAHGQGMQKTGERAFGQPTSVQNSKYYGDSSGDSQFVRRNKIKIFVHSDPQYVREEPNHLTLMYI